MALSFFATAWGLFGGVAGACSGIPFSLLSPAQPSPAPCLSPPQALEASLGGLEGSQAEGFRRLGGSLQSALQGAEEKLGAAVLSEARRSLEPVRRLPELLAAAMPVTPEVVMSPDGLLVRRRGLLGAAWLLALAGEPAAPRLLPLLSNFL